MKKKNKIMVVGQGTAGTTPESHAHGHGFSHLYRNVLHRLPTNENMTRRTEIQTERGKSRKSKSPLQVKDTNRMKTKQSTSKSPIKLEGRQSGLPRKVAPLNLQGLSLSMAYSGGELSKTLTSRRSVNKKQR